jgi:hypothetical protein
MTGDSGYTPAKLVRDLASAIAFAEGKNVNWSGSGGITGTGVDRAYLLQLFEDAAKVVREINWRNV